MLMLQRLVQIPAESVLDKFLILLLIGEDDITLIFSAYSVLQLCSTLSKLCKI